ncbi:receptor-like serine/threonine-protein kinase SD1-6 [Rhododendron vialii]|uniref:receptor-like serine/threonine-protein kinase SD1-6 n=1 Tax=Rhododendron vialii TaxID=182163 RepID=UPI00265E8BA9|nr:receptor-like serine/threonine-protein kinase SD1-6 [Rhododendron vialii]XP_058180228.1 receptor-like serine/threonine-protein kinase SD1-6 [Rhododendron vialii]
MNLKLTLAVGMYGYVPPKYVKCGIYSTKSYVYRFGVLLLQIIIGKRNNCSHGLHEDLNLLDYAYDLWKCGKGMEFMNPLLDDTNSSCKLVRRMQIALLCIQENPANRLSMLELSSMLKNETTTIITPKRPAFSTRRAR